MMKYNDAYSMMGAMINQAFADQHEKRHKPGKTQFSSRILSKEKVIKCRNPVYKF